MGSPVIGNGNIRKFHGWISKCTVFGHPALDPFSPHFE
jgi:hypothetical protein